MRQRREETSRLFFALLSEPSRAASVDVAVSRWVIHLDDRLHQLVVRLPAPVFKECRQVAIGLQRRAVRPDAWPLFAYVMKAVSQPLFAPDPCPKGLQEFRQARPVGSVQGRQRCKASETIRFEASKCAQRRDKQRVRLPFGRPQLPRRLPERGGDIRVVCRLLFRRASCRGNAREAVELSRVSPPIDIEGPERRRQALQARDHLARPLPVDCLPVAWRSNSEGRGYTAQHLPRQSPGCVCECRSLPWHNAQRFAFGCSSLATDSAIPLIMGRDSESFQVPPDLSTASRSAFTKLSSATSSRDLAGCA